MRPSDQIKDPKYRRLRKALRRAEDYILTERGRVSRHAGGRFNRTLGKARALGLVKL